MRARGRRRAMARWRTHVLVHEDVAVAGDALLAEVAGLEVVEATTTTRHGVAGATAAVWPHRHPVEPRPHLHVPLLLLLLLLLLHRLRRDLVGLFHARAPAHSLASKAAMAW